MFGKAMAYPYFALYKVAKKYIRKYEGFSYSFSSNGEERLLDALTDCDVKTVFDVGANVGDWAGIASRKFESAQIHCFEISRTTFKALQKKHEENHRVFLNNFGLGATCGEFGYKDYGENSGVNTLIPEADFHDHVNPPKEATALVKRGDDYCREKGISSIDLLKIDVEGAEHLVLQGFSEMLAKGLIKVIQFEYGYTNGDARFLVKDFYRLFAQHRYVLGPLKPGGVLFMDFDYALNDFHSGPNYVAVNENCTSIIEVVKGEPIKGFPRR